MKNGLLLINLGSPRSPKTRDVRKYLREFLMDGKVLDVPYLVRKILVEGIILPFRSSRSAKAYSKIWWEEGSPLVVISKRLADKVSGLSESPVTLGMRYGKPSIEDGIKELHEKGVEKVFVIPLYPQYAMSTTETVTEKVEELKTKKFNDIQFEYLPSFYNNDDYLDTLANQVKRNLPEEYDTLLFSYHGIPERHIYKTDKHSTCEIGKCCFTDESPSHATCYRHQCYYVTEKVRQRLDLPKKKVHQTFQSRLGRDPWLRPYTDKFLDVCGEKGKEKLAVVAPAFVSDCLETLEELQMEGKEEFIKNGGKEFNYIPCLNDSDEWANLIVKWFNDFKNK